jgi:hypothetical protein
MTRTNPTMQAEAAMPNAVRVRPTMLDIGWLDGVASIFAGIATGTQGQHGYTAKRSTRFLGRLST